MPLTFAVTTDPITGTRDLILKRPATDPLVMQAIKRAYEERGVKTFIVNHYGVVYEKDLGSKTAQIAAGIWEYNPDRTWTPVSD